MGRDWERLKRERKRKPEMCGLDSDLGVVVHRFAPGKIVCRCGRCAVRSPQTKKRAGWYGKGKPWAIPDERKDGDESTECKDTDIPSE